MDYGIALFPSPNCWKVVQRAEQLGFTHAWFYDSQMLASDVFACMALAAANTSRIKLGTGVLIPTNRIAPVAASAFGTLNQIAPGRIIFGVGTGFTGRNTMGQGPMPLKDMADYIRVVRGLLNRETVSWNSEGRNQLIRFLHPDRGFINQDDSVPVHVSAFGPKGQALAVAEGDGWMTFFGNEPAALAQGQAIIAQVEAAGRDASAFYRTAFTLGCVLEDEEEWDSPRAMAQAGPIAAVGWHGAMERWDSLPEPVRNAMAPQRALYESYRPENARYLDLHTGHLLYVRDDERDFVTGDALRAGSFTGTEGELRERAARFADAGYHQLCIQLVDGQHDAIEDWAKVFGLA